MIWDDVVRIARELPGVDPGSYHGYPALRVAGKFLVRLGDDPGDIEFKALHFDERELLIEQAPEVFHLPAGFRGAGLFARLARLDEARLRDLLEGRWRAIAPKALMRARDPGA